MDTSELENREPETDLEKEPKTGKYISMKSFVAILIAVCLAFGAVIGVIIYRNGKTTDEPAAAQPADSEAETAAGVDLAAMHSAHDDDEVVMTIDGSEVKWDEYFYWLSYNISMIESYVGAVDDWNAEFYDGQTYAQFIREAAESSCKQYHTLETLAKDNNISLTEEDIQAIAEQRASDIASYCGEGATEDDFTAYLAELNMTPEIYDYITGTYQLYQSGFFQLYGKNGEKLSEEDIQAFLADNDYMNANHILFMTIDPATGEAVAEDAAAEKLAQAQALVEELRAIEDTEELTARFVELKAEYCEDTGKEAYPNGYVFTPGMMVEEFENGVLSLGEYEISDPIESPYGYHIILRLPLSLIDADTVVDTQYGYTAGYAAAAGTYAEMGSSYFDNADVRYMPGFENFSVADIA